MFFFSCSLFYYLLIIVLSLILYLVYKVKKTGDYFKNNGIPYLGASLSSNIKFLIGTISIVEVENAYYKAARQYKNSPVVGLSDFFGTSCYVTDLDVIKAICVKDFDHFVNRRPISTTQTNKYIKRMLFFAQNEQWKGNRAKMSPIFTTGKIKRMFSIFKTSSENMEQYLKMEMNYPKEKSMDIDFLQIFSKYAMDVIASCAFGIDGKSFQVKPEEKSTFERMASQFVFKFSPKLIAKFMVILSAPKIADMLGVDMMDSESQNYFSGVISDVMKRRRMTGERRDDFLQLMMDVQDGILKEDEESKEIMSGAVAGDIKNSPGIIGSDDKGGKTLINFDDDHVVANGMLFLMAGFDPTQSVLLFTVYTLALESEIQEKLYEEVKSVLERHGGVQTYDAISEMKYLEMVLNESQRFYVSAPRAERLCAKDYVVPGTNILIEKGSVVSIPIQGIHHDPRYFSTPEKFIPERFSPENKATRHPYAFMPFGHGPRNCIGNRFALVKVKAVLVQLIRTFRFAPCSKTKIPMEYDRNPSIKPKGGMWLNITLREN